MSYNGWSSEEQNVDRNMDSKGQAHEVSIGNKDPIVNWTKGHVRYTLAKKLSSCCASPESLQEIETKGDGIIDLPKEISRQFNIQGVAWVLLVAFSQIYITIRIRNKRKIK